MTVIAVRALSALVLLPVPAAAPSQATPPAASGTLTIQVGNVRSARGRVHVDLCPQAMFLKEDCPYSAEAPAHAGITVVTMRGIAPGHYGIQASHDENGNGRVDRALFGIPKEGVGFSNDALKGLSAPKWADAAFTVTGGAQLIRFRMRYFLGASGPG